MSNLLGVRPSFSTGFAQSPGESEYPELWNGLIGFWPFFLGQTGGKVPDLSGKGNTGTLVGTAPSWTSGKFGSAVLLPGTDELIEIENSADKFDFGTDSFTIWAWINPGDLDGFQTIVANKPGGADTLGFRFSLSTTNLQINMGDGVNNPVLTTTFSLAVANQWLFVAAVIDRSNGNVIFYLDNNSEIEVIGTLGSIDSVSNLNIGNRPAPIGNQPLNAKIDHIAIRKGALSASEVALLYSNPTALVQLKRRAVMVSVGVAPVVGNPMLLEGQLINSPLLSGRLIA